MTERAAARMVRMQSIPLVGRIVREFLALWSIDIPRSVVVGHDLRLEHRGHGVVINGNTILGDHVTIYHNVTIARGDSWVPVEGAYAPVRVDDDAILCPGAVVLNRPEGIGLFVNEGVVG